MNTISYNDPNLVYKIFYGFIHSATFFKKDLNYYFNSYNYFSNIQYFSIELY